MMASLGPLFTLDDIVSSCIDTHSLYIDTQHHWHSYTSVSTGKAPYPTVAGLGDLLHTNPKLSLPQPNQRQAFESWILFQDQYLQLLTTRFEVANMLWTASSNTQHFVSGKEALDPIKIVLTSIAAPLSAVQD